MLNPAEEIYFWSGIMRDHADFILTTLSPRELYFIQTAQSFQDAFNRLREEARFQMNLPTNQTADLVHRAFQLLSTFINFKRLLLSKLLRCDIELGLPPTFINHMINEAMEFHRALTLALSLTKITPVSENITLHRIWLPDASGHASGIMAELDPTEAQLIERADDFKITFNKLFIKANELGQMLEKTCLSDGALQGLNHEVEKKVIDFIDFLRNLFDLRKKCKAMGTLKPLMVDHFIREEIYYLLRLRKVNII